MNAPTPPTTSLSRCIPWLMLLALAGYGWFLGRHAVVQPSGSDTSGYFNAAKLIAAGQAHAPLRTIEGLPARELPLFAYAPLGFKPDLERGVLMPTYPIGLPLLFLVFSRAFGSALGPNLTLIVHAVAAGGLIYVLARNLGSGLWAAILATLMLTLSPLTLMHAVQALSDVPSMTWVLAAVWLAWRCRKQEWSAAAAGFALGVAVLVRPTNLLCLLPIACALGWSWRRWLWLGLGGVPCALVLLKFNHEAYGSYWVSGYGDVSTLFKPGWGAITLAHYARWLPVVATPLVVLALGLPWLSRTAGRQALMLGAWILAYLGFYAFYYHTHEWWWSLRFILPALPAIIITSILVAQHLLASLPKPQWRIAAWVALVLLATGSNRYWNKHWNPVSTGRWDNIYPETIRWMQAHLPPDAVVLSMQMSGSLFYYTDYRLLRWDMLEDSWPKVRATLHAAKLPVYTVLFDFEEKRALEEKIPGPWVKMGQMRQVGIWRLDPGSAPP